MKKTCIGLGLTLLICNFALGIDQQQMSKEEIAQTIGRYNAELVTDKKLTAAGNKQNMVRRGALAFVTTIAGLSYAVLQRTEQRALANLIPILGLTINTAVSEWLPYKDTETIQADIDHRQKDRDQLKAVLAAIQTKNPSTPEATVETK